MILYEISGRQFPGVCSAVVRPCKIGCGCWDWNDYDTCGDHCGCGSLSVVTLAGYPVTEITEVLIDGVVVDPLTYRLDGYRDLVRLDDYGPSYVSRSWPGCQNLALDSDQPGTWQVTYNWGVAPPPVGLKAAAALACELWNACPSGSGKCRLPGRVTKVVRQGVTFDRVTVLAELLRMGATGILDIDLFIGTYNPSELRRRPSVWSPDVPQYPRRTG